MMHAPIAIFAYRRLDHLVKVVESVLQNPEAIDSDLFLFSDASKKPSDDQAVSAIREYASTIKGFKSVTVVCRDKNFGLSKSIISGVTMILDTYERIIVLEDDIVVSKHFLTFMNTALSVYSTASNVASISGFTFQTKSPQPENWFFDSVSCWGWATWKHSWSSFRFEGTNLLDELIKRNICHEFDFNSSYPYTKMLKDQIKKKNDSWAIRWYASTFLAGALTLFPGKSLVSNIGWDGTGENCSKEDLLSQDISNNFVSVLGIKPVLSVETKQLVHESLLPFSSNSLKRFLYKFKIRLSRILP